MRARACRALLYLVLLGVAALITLNLSSAAAATADVLSVSPHQ